MRGGMLLNDSAWGVLARGAYIDFAHDFNDSRAGVTIGTLNGDPYGPVRVNKIRGISELMPPGRTNTTAFAIFRDAFLNSVAGGQQLRTIAGDTIPHEEDILAIASVPYAEVISSLPNSVATMGNYVVPPSRLIGPEFNQQNYEIKSAVDKARGQGYRHLAQVVSGLAGTNVFIIMFDAAGCRMNLGDPFPAEFQTGQSYHFFILNSKENISDPATKPSSRNIKESIKVDPTQNNVFIYFLEEADPNHVSTYPFFTRGMTDPNGAAFSGYTLLTRRGGPEDSPIVSAELITPTGQKVFIDDVKRDSEVAAATQKALTLKLNGESDYSVLSIFLMKRMGDWCQALCLLDKSRKYKVVSIQGLGPAPVAQVGAVMTIGDIETKLNGVSVLLTLDRVLLAFAICLGINIFYTSIRGELHWTTYFKNTAGAKIDDREELLAGAPRTLAELEQTLTFLQGEVATLNTIVGILPAHLDEFARYPDMFTSVRRQLTRMAFLPRIESVQTSGLDTQAALTALTPLLAGMRGRDPTDVEKYQLLPLLATLRTNASLASTYAQTIADAPNAYDTEETEKAGIQRFIDGLRSGQTISPAHSGYTAFIDVIDKIAADSKRIGFAFGALPIEDVDRVYATWAAAQNPPWAAQQVVRPSRALPNPLSPLKAVFTHYNSVLAGQQRGGAGTIQDMFNDARQVVVTLQPDQDGIGQDQNQYTPVGGYIGQNGFLASVIDKYVFFTDMPIEKYLTPPVEADDWMQLYACVRYALFMHDSLRDEMKLIAMTVFDDRISMKRFLRFKKEIAALQVFQPLGAGLNEQRAFINAVTQYIRIDPPDTTDDEVDANESEFLSAYAGAGGDINNDAVVESAKQQWLDAMLARMYGTLDDVRDSIFWFYYLYSELVAIGHDLDPRTARQARRAYVTAYSALSKNTASHVGVQQAAIAQESALPSGGRRKTRRRRGLPKLI